MAKGRIRSRMELREQYEAAEAREREARGDGAEDEVDDDEDVGDLDESAEDLDEDEVVAKPKKKAVKKPAAKPRKKTSKVVRKRVVWVVYDNSNKKIQQFDYAKKEDALALMEKLKTEKKQTYFIQPVKEEMSE